MGGIISSPFFKVIAGGVLAFALIMVFSSIILGGKANVKEQTLSLKFTVENTLQMISDYQNKLKSSDLRSSTASLYSVLSNTDRSLEEYVTEKYSYKKGSKDYTEIQEEATTHFDEVENDLFEAKINGLLDRVFAHKMAYEISMITTKEEGIYNASSDETLGTILTTSYNSLNNLYDKFSNFSETK